MTIALPSDSMSAWTLGERDLRRMHGLHQAEFLGGADAPFLGLAQRAVARSAQYERKASAVLAARVERPDFRRRAAGLLAQILDPHAGQRGRERRRQCVCIERGQGCHVKRGAACCAVSA